MPARSPRNAPAPPAEAPVAKDPTMPVADVSLFDSVKVGRGRKHARNEFDEIVDDFIANPRIMAIPGDVDMTADQVTKWKTQLTSAARRQNKKASWRFVSKPAPEALSAFEGRNIFVLKDADAALR